MDWTLQSAKYTNVKTENLCNVLWSKFLSCTLKLKTVTQISIALISPHCPVQSYEIYSIFTASCEHLYRATK